MNSYKPALLVRLAKQGDVHELCELLNEIVEIGGTTAIENALSVQEFESYFLSGEKHLCCHVAVDDAGGLAGFQTLERKSKLPDDWADIATFARVLPKVAGVGTSLFAATKKHAQNLGVVGINATIRADNSSGLGYYEKMGFQTYSVVKEVPLADGCAVDRISKRLLLL
jgi:L-amino acid N-acyltransferase YncA